MSDLNLYSYADEDPVNFIDPYGLMTADDFLKIASDFSAGAGDTLSFGLTRRYRQWKGYDNVVDHCGGWYKGGEVAGVALDTAIGGAGGWKAGAKAAGKEFSHWVPTRILKQLEWVPKSLKGKNLWNGNYVTPMELYLTDPFRYPSGWRQWGPKLNPALQQMRRIPYVYDGAAAGAGVGTASTLAGRGCGCK